MQQGRYAAKLVHARLSGHPIGPFRYQVRLAEAETVEARTVVIATDARYRRLDVARIDELTGLGVYWAAASQEAERAAAPT